MSELVSCEIRDGVAVITINNPPVNTLSCGVLEGLGEGVRNASDDDSVRAIVLIGGGRTFIAGADLKELEKLVADRRENTVGLHRPLNAMEGVAKPIVCAIHGTALGGGFEIAMACHYRVAVPSAQVGQPEVKLGLIPGAAGTQRLPRLIGIAAAAEICATGRRIKAGEALELGMIDELIEGDLLEGALVFANARAASGEPPRKTSELSERLRISDADRRAIDGLKAAVAKKSRGLAAPLKAIEAVESAAALSFDEGCKKEGEIFFECLRSDASKGLIHIFFSERAIGKIPGITRETPINEIKQAAVIGAGTMGGGIAMNYANAGIPVVLKEADQQRLDKGVAIIRRNYEATAKKGRMTEEQVEQRMALINPTLNYGDIAEADIVVEAVFENLELKKKVFTEIDAVAKEGAILASNTSTIDIDRIASATKRPEQVIGHHFFSPANVMKLLEIVRGKASSDTTIATSLALAKKLRKVGVVVGNCFGFVGNRMFFPYTRESQFLVEEGASVEEVDQVLWDFGMAMGPLAVFDLAGNDIGWRIKQEIKDQVPEGMRQELMTDMLYETGRHGQKTGKGWYRYEPGNRKPFPDPEFEKLVEQAAEKAGIERREIDADEIIERTVYALINEGARILGENIALRSGDIDIVYVYGYGFPPHRGGPMFYAGTVGLKRVYDRVCQLEAEQGFWWKPAPLLKELAESGKTFGDWDSTR
ncbi:MAG: 3-hydroxyacyl-CoA dehydrogenase NAD-binding domain-containing protein [Pirellulaceae bacterium]